MADETLRAEIIEGNKRSHEGPDVAGETEIVLLKSRMAATEVAVDRIGANVQKLLDRPQNPALSQVLTTLVTTLAFCSFIFGFAEWRLGQGLAPVKAEITTMQQKADWATDSVHAAKVQAAVLEERMSWIKAALPGGGKPPQ